MVYYSLEHSTTVAVRSIKDTVKFFIIPFRILVVVLLFRRYLHLYNFDKQQLPACQL